MKRNKLQWLFLMILVFVIFLRAANVMAKTLKIAIVKSKDIGIFNLSAEGFTEALKENGNKDILIKEYTLKENEDIIAQFKDDYDLVCAIGGEAVKVVKGKIKEVPLVFSMVLNPVENGLVKSMVSSGYNMTGASLNTPAILPMKLIKEILPKVKKVLVIYNPAYSAQQIEDIKNNEKLGFQLFTIKVASDIEIPKRLNELTEKPDAILLIPDMTVCARDSLTYIVEYTLKHKIPLIGFNRTIASYGAIFSYVFDCKDIGRQAGEQALKILQGKLPLNIPITIPRKINYILNSKTAEYLGVEIPAKILKNAEEVLK